MGSLPKVQTEGSLRRIVPPSAYCPRSGPSPCACSKRSSCSILSKKIREERELIERLRLIEEELRPEEESNSGPGDAAVLRSDSLAVIGDIDVERNFSFGIDCG